MTGTISKQVVTLLALKRYNHDLIAKLGLTNDTALYAYKSTVGEKDINTNDNIDVTTTNYSKATDVKQALDQLYDLVGAASSANLNRADASTASLTNGARVSLQNVNGTTTTTLANFDITSTDDNLLVDAEVYSSDAPAKVKFDVNSVSASATDGTGKASTYKEGSDPLTQKTYVDNAIAKTVTDNQTTFNSGKGSSENIATFTAESGSKKYYVNVTVGTNVYNIELDASEFLKDGFLNSVEYKSDSKTIDFTWNTDAKVTEVSIKASDILGNLVGGDGIAYDADTMTISVDLASAQDPYVTLEFDDNKKLKAVTKVGTVSQSTDKTWSTDTKTTLATSDNLATVANALQQEIEANAKAHSVTTASNNGTAATNTDPIYVANSVNSSNAQVYTITYATATDEDIDALFA